MRHTIAVLVEDRPGVLARVAGLFRRRGFNIESLAVGITEKHGVSRMTIVVSGDDRTIEQVTKQLNKLIEVIKVSDVSKNSVERELALVKVSATPQSRAEIIEIANIFRARIVDVARDSLIVEVTGDEDKISAFIDLMKQYGIKEVTRTGKIAMQRGSKALE
ncbi:acetolactate synthase small subunit [Geoglobus acetivorans]|uniref:Acetolactate synthase small subunit n=1 Tax=Geoglobus acetivorans TaxID=565033 RepID=A0A0A7GEZ1_GEOAI|nr:Acetolactate synthase small subunit [Geoglobus acetivorans]